MRQMHRMLQVGKKVDYITFLAACSYQMGLSDVTTEKYLSDLEILGFIEVNEKEGWIQEVVTE